MSSTAAPDPVHLKRSLRLRDLVLTGIILVQPTAPMPLFGVVQQKAQGHVVTTILVAMVAMLITAISYGRMARVYPSAGSAYTYVGQEIHPALGYSTGWSMLMDYVLNPLICTIWCSKAAMNIVPSIPYVVWTIFFAGLFTTMNLRKVEATARTNAALAVAMGIVIIAVLIATVRYVGGMPDHSAAMFFRPFYDPATFRFSNVATGTSLAVLTYIGFDGISTLSEEVHDPRKNILSAMVLVCLTIGILSAIEVYAAQLVWPAREPFPDVDTAYVYFAGRIGGAVLFQVVNFTLLVATIGSGAGGQLAGARLLYGMGRDRALPQSFFGYVNPHTQVPSRNVILIGAVCLIGAWIITYETGAELLNFGALIGFMGVNLAAFLRYFVRGRRTLGNFAMPLVGFLICLAIWLSLRNAAKIAGLIWLAAGILYGAWKTKGFREPIRFDAPA
jgi:amino acid transporter